MCRRGRTISSLGTSLWQRSSTTGRQTADIDLPRRERPLGYIVESARIEKPGNALGGRPTGDRRRVKLSGMVVITDTLPRITAGDTDVSAELPRLGRVSVRFAPA